MDTSSAGQHTIFIKQTLASITNPPTTVVSRLFGKSVQVADWTFSINDQISAQTLASSLGDGVSNSEKLAHILAEKVVRIASDKGASFKSSSEAKPYEVEITRLLEHPSVEYLFTVESTQEIFKKYLVDVFTKKTPKKDKDPALQVLSALLKDIHNSHFNVTDKKLKLIGLEIERLQQSLKASKRGSEERRIIIDQLKSLIKEDQSCQADLARFKKKNNLI